MIDKHSQRLPHLDNKKALTWMLGAVVSYLGDQRRYLAFERGKLAVQLFNESMVSTDLSWLTLDWESFAGTASVPIRVQGLLRLLITLMTLGVAYALAKVTEVCTGCMVSISFMVCSGSISVAMDVSFAIVEVLCHFILCLGLAHGRKESHL